MQDRLVALFKDTPEYTPDTIRDALSRVISDFDAGIGQKLLDLFPDPVALSGMYSGDIEDIINDDGPNSETVLRCMRGSTALISIIDPAKKNLWVASLGDCAAGSCLFELMLLAMAHLIVSFLLPSTGKSKCYNGSMGRIGS